MHYEIKPNEDGQYFDVIVTNLITEEEQRHQIEVGDLLPWIKKLIREDQLARMNIVTESITDAPRPRYAS